MTKTLKNFKIGKEQRKWVKALESGKYRQTQTTLCRITKDYHKKFCCLGLLCWINNLEKINHRNIILFNNERSELPSEMVKKLKFYTNEGHMKMDNLNSDSIVKLNDYLIKIKVKNKICDIHSIVQLNDTLGLTFKQIAYFVKTWPQIFFKGPA